MEIILICSKITIVKMKNIFFLLFCLLSVFSCNQGNSKFSNSKDELINITQGTNKCTLKFDKHGQLSFFKITDNNLNDNTHYEFFSNGGIKLKYTYRNGVAVKSAYEYHSSGCLRCYKFFDTRGRLAYMRIYNENGSYKSESGQLITIDEMFLSLKKDSLTIPILMPEPPGTRISCTAFLKDINNNIIDSMIFSKPEYAISISINDVNSLLFNPKLDEGDVYSSHEIGYKIDEIIDLLQKK